MQIRKDSLTNNSYFHIFSRSIAKYKIFNNEKEYLRFLELLQLYRFKNFNHKYSKYLELDLKSQKTTIENLKNQNLVLVEIVAYCIMPTHVHLLLKQIDNQGISKFISKVFNSYARYFNFKHHRTGPLWAGRFKNVLVSKDEQLLHLTRYIHLNPASAGLVKRPNDWVFSSYLEYIDKGSEKDAICSTRNLFSISPKEYKKFVLDQKSYQRDLAKIKSYLFDSYTG